MNTQPTEQPDPSPPPPVSQRRDGRTVVHEQHTLTDADFWVEYTTDDRPPETRLYDEEWEHLWTLPGRLDRAQIRGVQLLVEHTLRRGRRYGEESFCRAIGARYEEPGSGE